jgi:hypothetical protein
MSLTRVQPSALDKTLNYTANTFTANYITFGDGTTQTTVSSSNSFSTILVSGQSNVIANTTTSILTLVAGSGITITTSQTSNTITFNSTGGFSGGTITNQLIVANTTASTSNSTGALIVQGGAGISGNLYIGNIVLSSITSGITFGDGTKQTTAGGGGTGTASLSTIITTVQGWNLP